MLRRKRLPGSLQGPFEAFRDVVEPLERAKRALTESVPSTRLPGRSFAEALLEFEEGLREVAAGMAAWRAPEVEAEWRACGSSIDEALAMAEHLRLEAEIPEGFEALIGTIGELLAPLEVFRRAAERFRTFRRSHRAVPS